MSVWGRRGGGGVIYISSTDATTNQLLLSCGSVLCCSLVRSSHNPNPNPIPNSEPTHLLLTRTLTGCPVECPRSLGGHGTVCNSNGECVYTGFANASRYYAVLRCTLLLFAMLHFFSYILLCLMLCLFKVLVCLKWWRCGDLSLFIHFAMLSLIFTHILTIFNCRSLSADIVVDLSISHSLTHTHTHTHTVQ